MNSFYSKDELKQIGFKSIGENVFISRKASFYGTEKILIGNNVRIDDFCILSGKITLGDYIHIAAYTALYAGSYEIILNDFVTISSRNVVYAESDDYTGCSLAYPFLTEPYRKTYGGNVTFERYSLIGTGCTVLPNTTIEEGCSVGAMSLVNRSIAAWGVYVGVPVKRIKDRDKDIKKLAKKLLMFDFIV